MFSTRRSARKRTLQKVVSSRRGSPYQEYGDRRGDQRARERTATLPWAAYRAAAASGRQRDRFHRARASVAALDVVCPAGGGAQPCARPPRGAQRIDGRSYGAGLFRLGCVHHIRDPPGYGTASFGHILIVGAAPREATDELPELIEHAGPAAARERVRVANKLGEFPVTDDALRRGEISYSKVRAVLRVATPANEALLLGCWRGGGCRERPRHAAIRGP